MSESPNRTTTLREASGAPPGPGFRRILCVADPGGESDAVLARAVELAERHAAGTISSSRRSRAAIDPCQSSRSTNGGRCPPREPTNELA